MRCTDDPIVYMFLKSLSVSILVICDDGLATDMLQLKMITVSYVYCFIQIRSAATEIIRLYTNIYYHIAHIIHSQQIKIRKMLTYDITVHKYT